MPDWIEDRNGNKITLSDAGNGAFTYTDTLGRQLVSSSGFGASGNTISVAGLANPFTFTWGTVSTNVSIGSTVYSSNGVLTDCNGVSNLVVSTQVITAITLPNGKQYQLNYDPAYGLVSQITYPSGGWVKYTWGLFPREGDTSFSYPFPLFYFPDNGTLNVPPNQVYCEMSYDMPAVTKRQVSFDGVNVALEQDFEYSTTRNIALWVGSQTTVTTKDLITNTTSKAFYTYSAVANNFAPNGQGIDEQVVLKDASDTILRTSDKVFQYPDQMLLEKTTLEDGQTSQTVYQYAPINGGTPSALAKEEDEYGFGANAPGALIRKTITTYASFPNTPIFPNFPSIVDRPSSVIIYDGGNAPMSESDYSYDSYGTAGIASASATGHDDTSYGTGSTVRGNATSVTRKCFIPGTSNTCADATTSYGYDQTGQVRTAKDANGNITSYSYDDSFSEGTAPANTNAYLTKITQPKTGNVDHIEQFSYAYGDGRLTVATDQNLQQTKYFYNDSLRRLTEVDFADHGKTTYDYHNDSLPLTVTKTVLAAPDPNVVTSTTFDGLGHVAKTSLDSDPAGATTVDYTYAGFGGVLTASNPHRATSAPTDGITTTQYDALKRVIQVTKQDGSISTVDYSQPTCPVSTDEANKQRKACSDALGRLVEVDEPGGVTAGSAAGGSLTIGGTLRSWTDSPHPASKAHIELTFSGTLRSKPSCSPSGQPCTDSGSIKITVAAYPAKTASYSSSTGSDSGQTVQALANAFHNDTNSPVDAIYYGADEFGNIVMDLVARTAGAAGNYTLSVQIVSNNPTNFTPPSFQVSAGSSLIDGQDASSGGTVYDYGVFYLSVGAFTASAPYGQSGNNTASLIASALVGTGPTGLNQPSSPVTAIASGSTITLTYKTIGAAGNVPVSVDSSSADPDNPSFTSAGTTLANGADPAPGSLASPYVTLYAYDVLSNLLRVDQKGSAPSDSTKWRTRAFIYDSLSRLLTVNNPESGQTSYQYDSNSNLISKTDARGITINYSPPESPIDALNRVTKKTYSNNDPSVSFVYDVPPGNAPGTLLHPVGRLVSTSNGSASNMLSYDEMGRVATEWQCTPLNCSTGWFRQGYGYDLMGQPTSHDFDAAFSINQSYDSAGRLAQVTSTVSDPQHPATLATVDPTNGYFPSGNLRKMTFGNGLTETAAFNNRLQACRTNLNSSGTALNQCSDPVPAGNIQDFAYGFNASSADNGNLASFSATGSQSFNRTYFYDSLNRLTSMSAPGSACSGLSWTYDPWANRTDQTVTGGTCYPSHQLVDTNNRLFGGYQYDAAGNLTNDASHTYTYDAESRLIGVDAGATATYLYDGEGRRVRKTTPSGQTHYFLDLQGDTAVEKDQNGVWLNDYLYNNGALLVQYKNGTTFFFTHDHLGSTRLMTGVSQNIVDSMDYLPYGEQIAGDTGTSHKLTGKERDSETQLDYFGARYYSNGLGRFITPDWSASPVPVPYANLTDPQSLNQYSYVRNLPTTTVDPDGHGAWNWLKCQFGSEAACAAEREERLNTQKKREEESARIEKERAYLLQHMHNVNTSTGEATPLTDAQIYRLQHASQTQIDEYFQLLNEDAEDREARQVPPIQPVGSRGSTGRTQPRDLREQLAMEQAKSNPAAGQQVNLKGGMKDPNWPASQGWVKMRQNINGVEIHYVRNTITGAVDDFKFVAP